MTIPRSAYRMMTDPVWRSFAHAVAAEILFTFVYCDIHSYSFCLSIFWVWAEKLRVRNLLLLASASTFGRNETVLKPRAKPKTRRPPRFSRPPREILVPRFLLCDRTKRAIGHRRRNQQDATAFFSTRCCGSPCLYFHCSRSDLRHVVPRGDIISRPEGLSGRPSTARVRNEGRATE